MMVAALPRKTAGESDTDYRTRLTPDQLGTLDWFNHDIAEAESYRIICSPS